MSWPVADLVSRLHARRSGNGWKAKCPAHDDREPSLSIGEGADGRVLLNCHAGCDVDSICASLNIRTSDLFPAKYPEPSRNGATAGSIQALSFNWREYVAAFTDTHVERLAKWRGYSIEFCVWLKQNELIGLYEGNIAFPVHDRAGKVGAVHYRLKDGSWGYQPQGAKVRPLVIGELVAGDTVYVFESQWHAFAFMDVSGERSGIIITRGASNGALVADVIPQAAKVYLWPQNDVPGEKLATDICSHTKATVKRVKIPAPYKDLNEWTKTGASDQDLLTAMRNSETIQEAPPTWSPEELFNAIKGFLTRYVVFSQPEHADVITLWILHTWVADYADFTPYIYLHSPAMRCGKTQVHRVVEPLVKNPLRTCNVSEAALYREIEESHPTLLWDEIDSIFGNRKSSEANENKRALLNAGYERDIRAIRMERRGSGFVKMTYDPFCPKILAGIGRLTDTIVDRSIPILIHRKLKTQQCQKYRRQDRANAKPLHDALEAWSNDAELQKTLRESRPQMPECLTDRQEDIWEPLQAIADTISGEVSELARAAARSLCATDSDEQGRDATQLAAIKKVVGEADRIKSRGLIDGLWEADALPANLMGDETPNYKKIGHWLSKLIQSYGGKPPRQLDFNGENDRGYEAAELKEIFERYCPDIDTPAKER
jgi:hypothetical protein